MSMAYTTVGGLKSSTYYTNNIYNKLFLFLVIVYCKFSFFFNYFLNLLCRYDFLVSFYFTDHNYWKIRSFNSKMVLFYFSLWEYSLDILFLKGRVAFERSKVKQIVINGNYFTFITFYEYIICIHKLLL